jgi:hypothetical protein
MMERSSVPFLNPFFCQAFVPQCFTILNEGVQALKWENISRVEEKKKNTVAKQSVSNEETKVCFSVFG